MPSRWRIKFWPECDKHVFLSHCAEDRNELVSPVYDELGRRGIVPWFDRHHYPLGREAIEALQEELLKCRHVIYFITPAMLCQGRGWVSAERALTALIQHYLRRDTELAHVELPLLFVETSDIGFQRSLWRSLADKGKRCPQAVSLGGGWDKQHVDWAADQVEKFVRQEEQWAIDLELRLAGDSKLRSGLERDRISKAVFLVCHLADFQ